MWKIFLLGSICCPWHVTNLEQPQAWICVAQMKPLVNLMACSEWGLGGGKGSKWQIQDLGAVLASTISKAQWESTKNHKHKGLFLGGWVQEQGSWRTLTWVLGGTLMHGWDWGRGKGLGCSTLTSAHFQAALGESCSLWARHRALTPVPHTVHKQIRLPFLSSEGQARKCPDKLCKTVIFSSQRTFISRSESRTKLFPFNNSLPSLLNPFARILMVVKQHCKLWSYSGTLVTVTSSAALGKHRIGSHIG